MGHLFLLVLTVKENIRVEREKSLIICGKLSLNFDF